MTWFVAIEAPLSPLGYKPVNRVLYPTRKAAENERILRTMESTCKYRVMNADHEPGRSILATAGP